MKDTILIVVFLLVIIGLGNSSLEVRDRAFIQSVSISTDENNIYTTVRLYDNTVGYKGIGDDFQTSLASAETRQGNAFFTGHTEIIIFSEDSFSLNILKSILKNSDISPNCAVVISSSEVIDTQSAYSILKNYDRIDEVHLQTASDTIKALESEHTVVLPLLNSDLTYTSKRINI